LDDGYQPRTIRHNNAVLRSFYDYWIERGERPAGRPTGPERGASPFEAMVCWAMIRITSQRLAHH
jgi:hypothetical protein